MHPTKSYFVSRRLPCIQDGIPGVPEGSLRLQSKVGCCFLSLKSLIGSREVQAKLGFGSGQDRSRGRRLLRARTLLTVSGY